MGVFYSHTDDWRIFRTIFVEEATGSIAWFDIGRLSGGEYRVWQKRSSCPANGRIKRCPSGKPVFAPTVQKTAPEVPDEHPHNRIWFALEQASPLINPINEEYPDHRARGGSTSLFPPEMSVRSEPRLSSAQLCP